MKTRAPQPGSVRRLASFCALCAILAALAALTWAVERRTRPAPLDQARVELRVRNLAEIHAAEKQALDNWGWIDRARGIVRLPINQAMDLAVTTWQDPAAGRSNLLSRLEKATAPLPNPYE